MGKLNDAVNKQYFTDEKMMTLAKEKKSTDEVVENLEKLAQAIDKIADTLDSNNLLLEEFVENNNIEDLEGTQQIISIIQNNLPTKEITALAKKLSATKKEVKVDEKMVLKSLGINQG